MDQVRDDSVHLIVTSPPYFSLKDYDKDAIGQPKTKYYEYLHRLAEVIFESKRVLHPGCRMCINIGESYASVKDWGRHYIFPNPHFIVTRCFDLGFDYMGTIIWRKYGTSNPSGGGSMMGSIYYPRDGLIKYRYERILLFKLPGEKPEVTDKQKRLSRISLEDWKKYFNDEWNIPGVKQDIHPAMFPEEIPRRLIRMFSFIGETVLDPFLGSGTTLKVAKELERDGIGYEINKDYKPIITKKIGLNQRVLK